MSKINACFCYPFVKPKEPSNLVLFCEAHDSIPEAEARDYLSRCRQYAKTYHVYLTAGPFIIQNRLCLCLLDPDGHPLAIQKATYLNLLHHAALDPADRIQVIKTELGSLSLLPGVDVFHPEVSRAAVLQGAEVLLSVAFLDAYDLNPIRSMSGCWAAAQANQVPVLGVSNVDCCVAAPCSLTNNSSGFILAPQTAFPALATVYPHKTNRLREEESLPARLNPAFIDRYRAQLSL